MKNSCKFICGSAGDVLPELESDTFACCVTSPPYFNLRDYGEDGQLGTESTVEEYIKNLVAIFRQVRRVMKSDGVLWIVIGDSYAGHHKGGSEYKLKDMHCVPWRLGMALRQDGWYLRQDIIWEKPNCMPESVKDRFTRSHEYVLMLTKSKQYKFNHEAVSVPSVTFGKRRSDEDSDQLGRMNTPKYHEGMTEMRPPSKKLRNYKPMRAMRDVWKISTAQYAGMHHAVFPKELVENCVRASSDEGDYILDPFAGSGTVGVVSANLGRNFVGIELNPKYIKLAEKRMKEETDNG